MKIGDLVRIKEYCRQHGGQLGIVTGRTGDHYYHVSLQSGEFLYADVALEALC
jgi:putative hemolysin